MTEQTTENMISCAVVSSDPTFCARIARLVEDPKLGVKLTSEVTTPLIELEPSVVEQMRRSDVRIVFLDIGRDPGLGLRFARLLWESDPGRTFILIGPPQADPEILLEAMRVGASEYLSQPIDEPDLAAALGRAARRLGSGTPLPQDPGERGRILAVLGAKGGTGVTTTAVNLAVHLQESTHKPTLLIDLDLEFGDSALMLGVQPRYSIFDVVRNLRRLDQNLLASLVEHHASGLDLMASPAQPNSGEALTKEQLRSALQFVRRHYANVVVDLPKAVTPATLAVLELADQALIVATPNLAVLRNTKKVLPIVQAASQDPKRVRVILNQRHPDDLITDDDVRKALGLEIYWTLDRDDAAADASAAEGVPVIARAKSRFGRGLRGLGGALAGLNGTNGKRSSGLVSGLLRPFRG